MKDIVLLKQDLDLIYKFTLKQNSYFLSKKRHSIYQSLERVYAYLDNQKPKKVKNRLLCKEIHEDCDPIFFGECPGCHNINLDSRFHNYCNICGTELDWGTDNE